MAFFVATSTARDVHHASLVVALVEPGAYQPEEDKQVEEGCGIHQMLASGLRGIFVLFK